MGEQHAAAPAASPVSDPCPWTRRHEVFGHQLLWTSPSVAAAPPGRRAPPPAPPPPGRVHVRACAEGLCRLSKDPADEGGRMTSGR